MAYSEKVLDHYENPRNVGSFGKDDADVGTGMVGAPACGDVMRLQIKVNASGIIEDAVFKTYGCGSAIASSSLLTEWVKGKTLDEAKAIKNTQIAEELALPPVKIHCSVLAEDAINAAIADVKAGKAGVVPEHLRDAHYAGAERFGHGQGYEYSHDAPHGVARQEYLPESLRGAQYYRPTDHGVERTLTERLGVIRQMLGRAD